jgi:hypothetical protein
MAASISNVSGSISFVAESISNVSGKSANPATGTISTAVA